ncbi:uncharacterized protein PGTG_07726 [Puccinia graminis f. sp. tritici CRL 75-36-700-3]|uniref:Golgi to ER traffic-protein n=1 Tax=Puccinia graminis f. sp. tritici (strain CRL 75-36-700-3 / race SCCL) TaxID=418459 RepID=E3KBH1_PUCGT|nr:uncharacterized protein PGTG_07726 [Puccinia graminis f. sp. tritici CRL 75-36-700-3]EFP81477.2 hypothetical protein PGTG_07726 [Puccinia graminis f. sp. tritici CRL 75-36-700-3]
MRDQASGLGASRNGSKSKGPAGPAKSGPRGSEWVTVPPKKVPQEMQRYLSAQRPPIGGQKSKRSSPTPEDFRTIGREGAQLDPALSDDENGSEEELHVNETLTSQPPETPKSLEVKKKKKPILTTGPKASGSKSSPKVVVPKTTLGPPASTGGSVNVGHGLNPKLLADALARQEGASKDTGSGSEKLPPIVGHRANSKMIADALARHEQATRGIKSPDNMIPVGNGEFMSLAECRAFLDQFPKLSPVGVGTPARALSTGSSSDARKTTLLSTPLVAPTAKNSSLVIQDPPNTGGPPKVPKPVLASHAPGVVTPLHKGMMTRTPSTSSSITNAMLPNLATASLDQLKSMRRICSNTREMLSTSVTEIRSEDLHLLAPGAYGFQDRHLRLMTRYCSQLDQKIAEAENAGISDAIEVIDLTTDEPPDNGPSTSSVTGSAKRLSRPSEASESDDSPVMAKKTRTTVPPPPPGQYIQPNLPPYSFRDIPDKDLLAGIAPKFPVNRQPSISEFTSQFQSDLSLPYSPTGPPGGLLASSSKPAAPGGNVSNQVGQAVTDTQQPTTQDPFKQRLPKSAPLSTPSHANLPTAPRTRSGGVGKAAQVPGTRPDQLVNKNVSKPSMSDLATPVDMGDPVWNASDTEGRGLNTDTGADADGGDMVVDPEALKWVSGKGKGKGLDPVLNVSDKDARALNTPGNTKQSTAHKQTAADPEGAEVDHTGAVADVEDRVDEPEPPKKDRRKGKGKGQATAKEKAAKTTKKKLADMTAEEKAARLEERKEKAKARKEEKAHCVHAIPPQPGNLLAPMLTPKECEEARRAHKRMLTDSRNPQWDFGPELMDKVADMILAFKKDRREDSFYTKSPQFTPEPHMIDAIKEVFEGDFPELIMKCPRLLQVDAADPFWTKEAVDLSIIKKAHDSKDSVKAASWITLYGMMLRVDHYPDYTEDDNTVKLFDAAFRKIHTLTVSSFNEFHRYVSPSDKPVDKSIPTFKQDTALQAGRFVINKIKSLKVGAATSAHHGNARTGNGLMLLQRRIWDTLLCVLMMQQSLFQQDLEHCIQTGTYPNQTMLVSQHMSANQRAQSLYKHGDVKDTKNSKAMKEWGEDRLAAFGSMAIFFLYGAAGWWQFLTDSHHYNQKDVWVLVHLAKGKSDWIYERGHLSKRRTEDTPWYRIDSFVRWLLVKTKMHVRITDKVDWEAAPKFWAEHVTSHNIARLALQDVLSEVCLVTPLKSLNFNGEPAPDVVLEEDLQASVEKCRAKLTAGWQGLVEGTAGGESSDGSSLTEEEEVEEEEEEVEEEEEEDEDDEMDEEESEEEGEIRAPRPSGKPVHGKIPSSSSSDSGTEDSSSHSGPGDEENDDEDTDPHRSDSDGGVEERQRRRREHPLILYTSKVQKSG